ncbi:protein fantom [Cheilinus undulatus]|uniref:protein fantom n=1 Tax=Cheilinus undulatus TaxID=241271 RepID=UPI001BD3D6EF|nr:protein fantom [Cheilinus undulatus]
MSAVVDETAGDLPVRDVGLTMRGLMPTVQDTQHDLKQRKKHPVLKAKDPQRLFQFPREHLEDLSLRLLEENSLLRQHICTQGQRLRRMSTRLMRLRQACPGSSGVKERDMEDTIQELEAHVAMLESQKGVLQNKLSMAKQHIMDLGGRTPYKFNKGKTREVNGEARRIPQTAPPRYGPMMDDTKVEMERFRSSVAGQVKVAELELTAQALRESLREKEKEIDETLRDMKKQQAERHRITIREDVDLIRLQKQLSDKSTALRVTQERFNTLQEAYENQLEESQRSLKESQESLLEKVEQLTEQLKQERERTLVLEGELTSSTLSLQTLDKLQERISDLEGERDLIKENYNTLLERSLAAQRNHDSQMGTVREDEQKEDTEGEKISRITIKTLEEVLQAEREERDRLTLEKETLRQENDILQEQREREKEFSVMIRNKRQHLEEEVLHYKEQASLLQHRLDSITKEFDMSVEELSEILLQIKAFRMHQESRAGLGFLSEKVEDSQPEVTNIQASHAETVLELQKTRNLLLLEHHISKSIQEELNTVNQKMEKEREENRRRVAEKDKLLSEQLLQINTLQAQMGEFAFGTKRTVPVQYCWPAGDPQVVQDTSLPQLRAGESLLEIHLKAATFTPLGLRTMGRIHPGEKAGGEDMVTFCTYSLLDFEMHSTPLVSGSQPSYSFTSRYALTAQDLSRLEGPGSTVRVELHQALGGVRFLTHGSGQMSLKGTTKRRGGQVHKCVSITSSEGETIGVVDFRVSLFTSEPISAVNGSRADRKTLLQSPEQISLGWKNAAYKELHDYGCGVPNELEVTLERCVGLNARWPGLLPNAYLTYRLYDLAPHISQTVTHTSDPVFNDITSYPLAVTADVLDYLRSSSLWVYVFDDSEDQVPPAYLAKTPIPLRVLASGKDIRGDYVLRDSAGGPRGIVRVVIKWKYPIQPSLDTVLNDHERLDGVLERRRGKAEMSHRPVAKPRMKPQRKSPEDDIYEGTPNLKPESGPSRKSSERTSSTRSSASKAGPQGQSRPVILSPPHCQGQSRPVILSPPHCQGQSRPVILSPPHCQGQSRPVILSPPHCQGQSRPVILSPPHCQGRFRPVILSPPHCQGRFRPVILSPPHCQGQSRPVILSPPHCQGQSRPVILSPPHCQGQSRPVILSPPHCQGQSRPVILSPPHCQGQSRPVILSPPHCQGESDLPQSSDTSSPQSDVIIFQPQPKLRKGNNLRVEILSLTFEPSSHVALDDSVQRVYVEYRLLGIPMETTETPMSLRKPVEGKEIHFNFTRVIYVDGSQSAPLRHYLFTMLEGTDPNQGRLKFTVVSEPMDDDQECVDVGHAFLNLQELLLTENDVIDQQINIVSADENKEVIGHLRVSLEAAKALTGIYKEFCHKSKTRRESSTDEEEMKLKRDSYQEEENKTQTIQVIDYDYDSDF